MCTNTNDQAVVGPCSLILKHVCVPTPSFGSVISLWNLCMHANLFMMLFTPVSCFITVWWLLSMSCSPWGFSFVSGMWAMWAGIQTKDLMWVWYIWWTEEQLSDCQTTAKLVNMHFRCRVRQAQIVDHVLLLQHYDDLYKVMRHKNIPINICSGILLVIYCIKLPYCVSHFKPFLEGSFHPVSLMGHSCDVCWVNRCERANLLTSSMLFFLLLCQITVPVPQQQISSCQCGEVLIWHCGL